MILQITFFLTFNFCVSLFKKSFEKDLDKFSIKLSPQLEKYTVCIGKKEVNICFTP